MHASRMERDNNVVELVASKPHKKGWSLLIEAAIPTPAGVRRPDLVIHGLRKTAYVIDATIVADNADLYGTHLGTCQYHDTPAIRQWVKGVNPDIGEVHFSSVTLNWCGLFAVQSAETLCRDIGLSTSFLSLISQVVLERGLRIYQYYGCTVSLFVPRSTRTWWISLESLGPSVKLLLKARANTKRPGFPLPKPCL